MTRFSSVIVIGAGAAGLMCAARAATRGRDVIVLDRANKSAKKILMSGGGRCNFTNLHVEPENFISNNPHFCKSALSRYSQWDFIDLVERHEIDYYEKSLGQLFCKHSSKDIRDLLLNLCQSRGVSIQLKCTINTVESSQEGFTLLTDLGAYQCESLVVASGGLSIPRMGASGLGYAIAQQFGHRIFETRAGLSPFLFEGKRLTDFRALAGNSIQVQVSCNGVSFTEAMLFTHKGLSGPSILQISNYWKLGDSILINLMPKIFIKDWLAEQIQNRPEITLKTLLATQFSQAIASFFVAQLALNVKLKQITHEQCRQIESFLGGWRLYPSGLEGYAVAEVTLGGVDTREVSSKTFESKRHKGLYFIGEVLDVTGQLGGYNFQWAWASGDAAGKYV